MTSSYLLQRGSKKGLAASSLTVWVLRSSLTSRGSLFADWYSPISCSILSVIFPSSGILGPDRSSLSMAALRSCCTHFASGGLLLPPPPTVPTTGGIGGFFLPLPGFQLP